MPAIDLTISIVSTDDRETLISCLENVYSKISEATSFEVFVVDNANNISEFVRQKYPGIKIIINEKPKGFSGNHNSIARRSSGKYILFMNPDIFIQEGFVENIINTMKMDGMVGIVTGKLLRLDEKTIDSTGHIIYKNRRTVDRGQGEEDRGQYDKKEEVFSACGAAMLCRRTMLEDIKIFDEYFDESFRLYKEDLDLSWRARLRGWKIIYTPDAVAYHGRGWASGRTRAKVPRWIRRESYKNRYLMMIKDDHLINFLRDLPFILWHEIKALVYVIFREPHLFLAWPQIVSQLPLALKKRSEIMNKAVVGANEIRKWFT